MRGVLFLLFFILIFNNFLKGQEKKSLNKYEKINFTNKRSKVEYEFSSDQFLVLDKEELNKILAMDFEYPKLAKSKYWNYSYFSLAKLNNGYFIDSIDLKIRNNEQFVFHQSYIDLIKKIKSIQFKNTSQIDYPKYFTIDYSSHIDLKSNKLFHQIELLFNLKDSGLYRLNLAIDSTGSIPASYMYKKSNYYSIDRNLKAESSYSVFFDSYGSCNYKFWVDTNGVIEDINITYNAPLSIQKQSKIHFEEMKNSWRPAYEDGVKVKTYVDFTMCYNEKAAAKERLEGYDLIDKGDYELAINKLQNARNFYIFEIELLYNLALCKIKIEKYDEACKDLEEINHLAIDNPYPISVSEEKVNELIKTICPQTEE